MCTCGRNLTRALLPIKVDAHPEHQLVALGRSPAMRSMLPCLSLDVSSVAYAAASTCSRATITLLHAFSACPYDARTQFTQFIRDPLITLPFLPTHPCQRPCITLVIFHTHTCTRVPVGQISIRGRRGRDRDVLS